MIPVRLLARLLALANASPPVCHRTEFYALKDRLLRRHGRTIGREWQEITRYCYRCEGRGEAETRWGDHDRCKRCGGTGVYDRFWVDLERWDLAGRVFHRPAGRTWRKPEEAIAIVGYVRHAPVGRAGDEAALWLALLYDRPLFVRLMTGGGPLGPTWRYPLCTVRKLTGRLGMLREKFRRRRCVTCGRAFRQGLRAWRSYRMVCARCDRPRERTPVLADDDIPF